MKKFLLGLTVGVMISTAGTAFAASGLIGKKVQSEVQIKLDGKNVSNGVIIDGSTYAPVRSITESVGLDVGYSKGVVTLTSESGVDVSVPEIVQDQGPDTSDPYWMYDTTEEIDERISILESSIVDKQNFVDSQQKVVDQYTAFLSEHPNDRNKISLEQDIESRKKLIEKYNGYIESSKEEIEALKAKLESME